MAHGMENTDGFEFPRSVLGVTMSLGKCLISTLRFYKRSNMRTLRGREIMCRLHNDAFITDD